MANHPLYDAANTADAAWHAELVRVFGKNAGDARYDKRGVSTETLRNLHTKFRETTSAWIAHLTAKKA
jgi:hypothetical protein